MSNSNDGVANRLIQEKSPYLLQHAYNLVNWYPWGEEAFAKAKAEDKPIFLSIGYSTCHWCHVMERESFEDEEVARVLNRDFISIKVDREERPDIDSIYMEVCQLMTGHGGWPLTIVMTPEEKPFFAATYLPKTTRSGMAGLIQILDRIIELWDSKREELVDTANQVTNHMATHLDFASNSNIKLDEKVLHNCFDFLVGRFDSQYGGFSSAPKFPTPHNLCFLLRYYVYTSNIEALDMVKTTLKSMYNGGIYDHIGFGFARYATDRKWLIPHFEKMLYDNALLALAFLETYQITKDEFYAKVAREIFTYVMRDMTSNNGGFFSAEDADSEGVEGKFYVWEKAEIIKVLGEDDGEYFCSIYDITDRGNFEGKSIPNLIKRNITLGERSKLESLGVKLFHYRNQRIHPHKDDKILTAWNGLMIAAFAYGAKVLGEEIYLNTAKKALDFIMSNLRTNEGRLLARYRDGEASYLGYAADYAYLTWGLIELYKASYEPHYLEIALELTDDLIKYFWDEKNGGLFLYGDDAKKLLIRPKESYDGAIPADNSVALLNFLRLFRLTGRTNLAEKAENILNLFAPSIKEVPLAHTYMLLSILYQQAEGQDIVITGNLTEAKSMLNMLNEVYLPFTEVVFKAKDDKKLENIMPFVKDIKLIDEKTTAYICKNMSCIAPTNSIKELSQMLYN